MEGGETPNLDNRNTLYVTSIYSTHIAHLNKYIKTLLNRRRSDLVPSLNIFESE